MRVVPHRVEDSGGPRRAARPPRGAGTLGERLTVLQRLGYRATPQRRAILAGMLGAGRENVSAEEICRRARTTCPTVNLATTYRTLDLFGRLGMVRRLSYGDGRSVFCPNAWPHYHGMCLRCGAVIDIPRGRVTKVVEQEQSKLTDGAFIVVDHRVEFFGYCGGCGAAASSASGS